MMKGFKEICLMLAALALVFAGCAPGSSTDDSASPSTNYVDGVPVYVNPEGQFTGEPILTIGGPEQTAQLVNLNGRDVEFATEGCAGEADGAICGIRVTNRDADEYMANVFVTTNACVGCAGADFDNADVCAGATLGGFANGDPGGASTQIDGCEYCIVEDGNFRSGLLTPFNEYGCKEHTVTALGLHKPLQIIHPECGSVVNDWDFGGQLLPNYYFTIGLNAEYYPWDPTGDGRFDFTDRSTFVVQITDLADNLKGVATNAKWFRIGSAKRSNVIAGYGAGSSGTTMIEGQYFGVNLQLEYPDRIESRNVGDPTNFTNYEYYFQYSWLLKFDPSNVGLVGTGNLLLPSGSRVAAGHLEQCSSALNCSIGKSTYTGVLDVVYTTENDSQGWLAVTVNYGTNHPFIYMSPGIYYSTTYGAKAFISSFMYTVPARFGHAGIANINMSNTFLSSGVTNIMSQQGADAAPDFPLRMYYFYTRAGSAGKGSEFWYDTASQYTNVKFLWTNGTIAGGRVGGTDDVQYCWPWEAGGTNGCNTDNINRIIGSAEGERSNYAIGQSGESVPGFNEVGVVYHRGAYQQHPAHVCVQ